MQCLKCGKTIPEDGILCPYCGTKISSASEEDAAQLMEGEPNPPTWSHCRKCGAEIPEDSVFCPACGESAETSPPEDIPDDEPLPEISFKKLVVRIFLVIFIVAGLVCTIGLIHSLNNICNYSDCEYQRKSYSNYCHLHECNKSDCNNPKDAYDQYCQECACAAEDCSYAREGGKYCSYHTCNAENCLEQKVNRGSYCVAHTCDEPNCTNKTYGESTKCYADLPSLRKKLEAQQMGFHVTYNEGVEFTFVAVNQTEKTIKYIRFKLYLQNAVGDPVYDKATGKNYFEVEIVGPAKPGSTISIRDKFLGYCNGELQRVDMDDIVIIYTDNTSDIGTMNYYSVIPR